MAWHAPRPVPGQAVALVAGDECEVKLANLIAKGTDGDLGNSGACLTAIGRNRGLKSQHRLYQRGVIVRNISEMARSLRESEATRPMRESLHHHEVSAHKPSFIKQCVSRSRRADREYKINMQQ